MASTSVSHSPLQTDTNQIYTAHLQTSILPELESTRHLLLKIENDIAEYEDLRKKIDELEKVDNVETLTELGAGVWVEAVISDTKIITLDLGLNLHLDMSLAEARRYTMKKTDILKMKRDTFSKKEEFLVWQVGQFHGAITEVN
ncbi:uncharacterized protein IL334_005686 [Kwoniella shivajii]|uniref:Prefoldin, alpha subunit n=1 Tax=Kwoniella shivajii TaxID=564305 RepID=A0ABZ1D6X4_9TREE|nr:hypothetical protein IL334_005686 [Kwoniella shivajii]